MGIFILFLDWAFVSDSGPFLRLFCRIDDILHWLYFLLIRIQKIVLLWKRVLENVGLILLRAFVDSQTQILSRLNLEIWFLISIIWQECGLFDWTLLRMRREIQILLTDPLLNFVLWSLFAQVVSSFRLLALQVVEKTFHTLFRFLGFLILARQTLARVHVFDVEVDLVVVFEPIKVDTKGISPTPSFGFADPVDLFLFVRRILIPINVICV